MLPKKVLPINCSTKSIFMCVSHSYDSAMNPPSSIQLTGIQNGQAQFRWTPIDSCTPVRYGISTNCSTQCSHMTTNQTTTSCTVSEPTTDVVICNFNIHSVVCGNLMGDFHMAVITLQGMYRSCYGFLI